MEKKATALSLIQQTGEAGVIESATPGLQGELIIHYTTIAPSLCCNLFQVIGMSIIKFFNFKSTH